MADITWLGQGGFLVKTSETTLCIDPYLGDAPTGEGWSRLTPLPMAPTDPEADLVLVTHDHVDHFDPETILPLLRARSTCRLAGPASVREHASACGVAPERWVRTFEAGTALRFGDLRITATPAFHSDPDAVGFLVECPEVRIYLSGDTGLRDDLAGRVEALAGGTIDLALVCINGRCGNMNADQALRVVRDLGAAAAAPIHYGMFAENTADPVPFLEAVRRSGMRPIRFHPGRSLALDGERLRSANRAVLPRTSGIDEKGAT